MNVAFAEPVNCVLNAPLSVNVEPCASVSVAEVAGAVIATLLIVVAAATPRTGVTSVGEVANASAPVPVSSVIAVMRFALDGVVSHAAIPVPSAVTLSVTVPLALVHVIRPEAAALGLISLYEVTDVGASSQIVLALAQAPMAPESVPCPHPTNIAVVPFRVSTGVVTAENAPVLGVVLPIVPGAAHVSPVSVEELIVPVLVKLILAPAPTSMVAVVFVPEVIELNALDPPAHPLFVINPPVVVHSTAVDAPNPVSATELGVIAPSVKVIAGVVVGLLTDPETPFAVTTDTVVTVPLPPPPPAPVQGVHAAPGLA